MSTIRLSLPRDARPHDDLRNVVHARAMETLGSLIAEQHAQATTALPQPAHQEDFRRVHNVITVDGARGTGKTTFILSAMALIRRGQFAMRQAPKLVILDEIDPTLIEAKENVFVSIIASIKRKVDDHFKDARKLDDGNRKHLQACYDEWQASLTNLARGLTLLDGVGSNALKQEAWEDPLFILQQGLKNATHGGELERAFHTFIARSVAFLQVEAFVLVFDDIDTDFARGWPVLEVIRKYLTTPKMIIVMSGDLALFSAMVRKRQWQKLGDLVTRYETKDDYRAMVDQLEDQYLMKILKPENRIPLPSLWELAQDTNVEHVGGGEQSILKVYGHLCNHVFKVFTHDDLRRYRRLLLSLPLRTNIQLLYAFASVTDPSWRLNHPEEESRQRFLDDLAEIFHSTLLAFKFPREMLAEPTFGKLTLFLHEQGLLMDGYRLRPEFTDQNASLLMVVAGASLGQAMSRSPAAYIDYMIKVGLPHEVAVGEPGTIGSFLTFVGPDLDEDAIQVARKHASFFPSNALPPGIVASIPDSSRRRVRLVAIGTLHKRLYGVEDPKGTALADIPPMLRPFKKAMDKLPASLARRYVHTPDSLVTATTSWNRSLAGLPFANTIDATGTSQPRASVYNLLGILGALLQADTMDALKRTIVKYSQIRDFRGREAADPMRAPVAELDQDDEDTVVSEALDLPVRVQHAFHHWIATTKNLEPVPVQVSARAWTRFYYTLGRIDQEVGKDRYFFGNILHRYIVALFNAVLVECLLHYEGQVAELRNPVTSDAYFMANLELWDNQEGQANRFPTSVFDLVFRCPLWSFYLDPDTPLFKRQCRWVTLQPADLEVRLYGRAKPGARFENFFAPFNAVLLAGVDRTGVPNDSDKAEPVPQSLSSVLETKGAFEKLLSENRNELARHFSGNLASTESIAAALRDVLKLKFRGVTSGAFDEAIGRMAAAGVLP